MVRTKQVAKNPAGAPPGATEDALQAFRKSSALRRVCVGGIKRVRALRSALQPAPLTRPPAAFLVQGGPRPTLPSPHREGAQRREAPPATRSLLTLARRLRRQHASFS